MASGLCMSPHPSSNAPLLHAKKHTDTHSLLEPHERESETQWNLHQNLAELQLRAQWLTQSSCLTLKVCGLTLLAGILFLLQNVTSTLPIEERWNEGGSRHYVQDSVPHPSPSSRLLLSFPKTVYRKHKSNAAWAHYGQPSRNILPSPAPQPGPSSVVLATQHPRTWRGGLVVCWCWLWCVELGVAWCHPVAWRGPIKPWENYVTFCWAGPFRAIEVQWIESCREVIFPLSCVCVWEKAGEKKKGGGQAGKSIVDMLMLLTISRAIKMSWSSTSKTSAPGPSHPFSFSDGDDLVPHKFDSYYDPYDALNNLSEHCQAAE